MFNAEPLVSRAPPAGLHFVADEYAACRPDNRLDAPEVILRRHDKSTDTLNRLGHEGCNVTIGAGGDGFLQILNAQIDQIFGAEIQRRTINVRAAHMLDMWVDHATQPPGRVRRQSHRLKRVQIKKHSWF